MVTDAVRGETVTAFSGNGTRGLAVKSVAVWRGGNIADSRNGFVDVSGNLIHAADDDDIGRAKD